MLAQLIHRIASNPWVYDQAQYYTSGFRRICRRLAPHLARSEGKVVLDVGTGTGNFIPLIHPSAFYIGLDLDPIKLRRHRKKWPSKAVFQGDASRLPIRDKSIGFAFCTYLAHHIPDDELPNFFSELARVVDGELVFVDAVLNEKSAISRYLCKYDVGSFLRPQEKVLAALEPWFEIEHVESYSIWHHFVLCVGRPRKGK